MSAQRDQNEGPWGMGALDQTPPKKCPQQPCGVCQVCGILHEPVQGYRLPACPCGGNIVWGKV